MRAVNWHPNLAKKMEENRYNARTLSQKLYRCRETVNGWQTHRGDDCRPVAAGVR